ncbi:MAG: hypothetical protein IPI30_19555 [Saprospiraceae bacterium]|nr:hypothetical protein [Candidatus Vicinibacter affinis]
MTACSFIGFDQEILNRSSTFDRKSHSLISWMLIFNCIIFYLGTFHFFNIAIKNNTLLYFIVFFLSYVYLSFTRMIIATHDHDLSYFHYHQRLKEFTPDVSVILRLLIVMIFAITAGAGFMFWTTEGVFYSVIENLQNGVYDHQPELTNILGLKDNNYEMLDNISDRILIMRLVLGPLRYLLIVPFLLTAFIMLLPFVLKMYLPDLSNGEYEKLETEIETDLVLSNYQYSNDVINMLRKNKFGLPPIRYESHYDPPFNTIPRYPPLEIILEDPKNSLVP